MAQSRTRTFLTGSASDEKRTWRRLNDTTIEGIEEEDTDYGSNEDYRNPRTTSDDGKGQNPLDPLRTRTK